MSANRGGEPDAFPDHRVTAARAQLYADLIAERFRPSVRERGEPVEVKRLRGDALVEAMDDTLPRDAKGRFMRRSRHG